MITMMVWLVVATRDTIWKPFIAVSAINFLISLLDVATGELPFIPTIFSPQWARPFSLCRRVILCSWYSRESDNFYCDSAPHILIDTFLAQSDLPAAWPDLNSKVSAEELWGPAQSLSSHWWRQSDPVLWLAGLNIYIVGLVCLSDDNYIFYQIIHYQFVSMHISVLLYEIHSILLEISEPPLIVWL